MSEAEDIEDIPGEGNQNMDVNMDNLKRLECAGDFITLEEQFSHTDFIKATPVAPDTRFHPGTGKYEKYILGFGLDGDFNRNGTITIWKCRKTSWNRHNFIPEPCSEFEYVTRITMQDFLEGMDVHPSHMMGEMFLWNSLNVRENLSDHGGRQLPRIKHLVFTTRKLGETEYGSAAAPRLFFVRPQASSKVMYPFIRCAFAYPEHPMAWYVTSGLVNFPLLFPQGFTRKRLYPEPDSDDESASTVSSSDYDIETYEDILPRNYGDSREYVTRERRIPRDHWKDKYRESRQEQENFMFAISDRDDGLYSIHQECMKIYDVFPCVLPLKYLSAKLMVGSDGPNPYKSFKDFTRVYNKWVDDRNQVDSIPILPYRISALAKREFDWTHTEVFHDRLGDHTGIRSGQKYRYILMQYHPPTSLYWRVNPDEFLTSPFQVMPVGYRGIPSGKVWLIRIPSLSHEQTEVMPRYLPSFIVRRLPIVIDRDEAKQVLKLFTGSESEHFIHFLANNYQPNGRPAPNLVRNPSQGVGVQA